MTIEARPLGVACNLSCTYCYQEPIRAAGNIRTKYDVDKMLAEIDRVGQRFNLFGGEALLVPKDDLERFFKHGFEKFGEVGLQTNGTLIDDDHIAMFKKYNVRPGISIDGAGDLNRLRWVGSEEKTDEHTQRTMDNIIKLRKAGIGVGVIITLHRVNGSKERLPRLMNFIRWLGDVGVKGGNLHTLEVDSTMPDQEKNVLTQEENIEAMLTLANFMEENPDLRWRPFMELDRMMGGDDENSTCYWNYCDPGDTTAVYGIEGNGALSNCGRTNKEGIDWYKADGHSYARYISFYNTPDEMGGCQGCRFWMMCGGSCPGEADENDFRNKTIHCKTQKAMLGYYEDKAQRDGLTPITKSPLRPAIEQIMLGHLARGRKASIRGALKTLEQGKTDMLELPVKEGNAE